VVVAEVVATAENAHGQNNNNNNNNNNIAEGEKLKELSLLLGPS
jgi:hypothetical protein